MKKKICIFIIMVVFTFVGLKTINASTLTKTDYLNKIEELEKDIDNLKKKIFTQVSRKGVTCVNFWQLRGEFCENLTNDFCFI